MHIRDTRRHKFTKELPASNIQKSHTNAVSKGQIGIQTVSKRKTLGPSRKNNDKEINLISVDPAKA